MNDAPWRDYNGSTTQKERTETREDSWIIGQRMTQHLRQLKRINRRRKRAVRSERKRRIYR